MVGGGVEGGGGGGSTLDFLCMWRIGYAAWARPDLRRHAMLEIIALYLLCGKVGEIIRRKGRKALGY